MLFVMVERTNACCSHMRPGDEKIMDTISRFCALDDAIKINAELKGVTLQKLRPCDTIHARTRNSDYQIFLLDPTSGRAMVRGGKYFTDPTEMTVTGSTFGGCMLKMGWLGVGLSMEFFVHGQRTVTSPVQSLDVAPMRPDSENLR